MLSPQARDICRSLAAHGEGMEGEAPLRGCRVRGREEIEWEKGEEPIVFLPTDLESDLHPLPQAKNI
jgi:hypothetical protein